MVKALDSPYDAGRRGGSWRKVKPVKTLDLVVLAVEWGSGRRQGWLQQPPPRRPRSRRRLRDGRQDLQGHDRRAARLADRGAPRARDPPRGPHGVRAARSWSSRSRSTVCRPAAATRAGWRCGSRGCAATGPTRTPRTPTSSPPCRRCGPGLRRRTGRSARASACVAAGGALALRASLRSDRPPQVPPGDRRSRIASGLAGPLARPRRPLPPAGRPWREAPAPAGRRPGLAAAGLPGLARGVQSPSATCRGLVPLRWLGLRRPFDGRPTSATRSTVGAGLLAPATRRRGRRRDRSASAGRRRGARRRWRR